jgi:hypothetical protein
VPEADEFSAGSLPKLNLLLDRYPHLRCDPADPPVFFRTPRITGTTKPPLLLR